MKVNTEIRKMLKDKNIKQYQLAQMMGITEFTLSRLMRSEMSEDKKNKIIELLDQIDDVDQSMDLITLKRELQNLKSKMAILEAKIESYGGDME